MAIAQTQVTTAYEDALRIVYRRNGHPYGKTRRGFKKWKRQHPPITSAQFATAIGGVLKAVCRALASEAFREVLSLAHYRLTGKNAPMTGDEPKSR